MKSLYTTIIILILTTTNLYSQFEFRDEIVSDPKFQANQFILNDSQIVIDPETLDSIITSTMQSGHMPGLVALIVKHDSIVWSRNYGYANVSLSRPVKDSTLFLMASISKTIMATAIMQLWEDNLFELDDNINDYLQPAFQVINPNFPNDTITFKMLMTHTSSIDDNWNILEPLVVCGDSPISLDSFLVNYFTPGGVYYNPTNFLSYSPYANEYHYTNAGSCILAYLVKKLSGMSFNQYCRENIFDPLSMNKTSWFLEGLDTTNIATQYQWIGNQYFANCHQGWPLYPVAFLRTNKIELEHFLSAYMNWGTYYGSTILDSTTVDTMLTVYKPVPSENTWQGLIWYQQLWNGSYLWGHTGGWLYGTSTFMFFHPEEDWGIIIFVNIFAPTSSLIIISDAIIDYASQYGDIYAINSRIDKPYMRTSNDSIAVRAEFSNFNQHAFTANAIYINSDSSFVDSIALFDDGLHGDSLANDGIWGGFIQSISEEDYFDIGISTIDTENSKYFYSENLEKFTTVGPVVLFSYEITSNDTTPGAGDIINYVLTLKNQSSEQTVMNVSTTLKSLDTLYQVSGAVNYGTIGPGETSTGTGYHTIAFSNQVPHNIILPIEIRISSDSILYWIDTLDIITDVKDFVSLPKEYSLSQNYPNPFNPNTTIKYSIPRESEVRLEILNVLGERVELLVNEIQTAGAYESVWDARNVSSGIYFYRMQAGSFIDTKKMILLK